MRWLRAFFLPVSLLVLVSAALIVPLPAFLEVPGRGVSLAQGVVVDLEESDVDGDFLLMSVRMPRATTVGLVRGLVDDRVTLLAPARVVPPGITDREYFDRQRHVFEVSGELAAAIGLQAAGVIDGPVEITGQGAVVRNVIDGAPADGLLQAGDVIVAANGEPVRTDLDLRGLIPQAGAASPLALRVRRGDDEHDLAVAPRVMDLGNGEERLVIGIELETHEPAVALPVDVRIDTGVIGGPSAGLMIALTVFDKARADIDLAAGRTIAGTGGLRQDGSVEPIGGIRQKVIAAHDAGAELFLVPRGQLDEARSAVPAGSDLALLPVGTLEEALAILQRDAAAGLPAAGSARLLEHRDAAMIERPAVVSIGWTGGGAPRDVVP